jgi:hypothetical protein
LDLQLAAEFIHRGDESIFTAQSGPQLALADMLSRVCDVCF